ncbi:MAG TPA: UvrD-helicase domain-containing protein [Candidatus Brocadiales bacterium]|nr:UvrD-helicase domain-containing protein [Candidatus Brocadiales bacterium]
MKAVSKLLKDVTEPQFEAITHLEGPLLVLAGAGSGKTRVITRRICYLIERGVNPYNILALTFTNKAADEMKERVLAYYNYPGLWISTFHSMCARILRSEGNMERLGYTRSFSIYDTSDTIGTIKTAMKELELDPTHWKPATMAATISNAKNRLLSPGGMLKERSDYYHQVANKVYARYQELLIANNALDFDDLQLKLIELLSGNHEVLDHYQEKFLFILIDEYQDTNFAQYLIQKLLSKKYRNICVTGDPDQSIYGWRGANLGNILDFEKDYPDTKVVRLEQNYRSTKRILQLASGLILHNKFRKSKELRTENPEGGPVTVVHCEDERAEAKEVAARAEELHSASGGSKKYSDMAIFYRTNAQSRVLEEAMMSYGIPYIIVSGVAFYQRREIKDILSYLRLLVNPRDAVAFERIINTPHRGIGQTSVERLKREVVNVNNDFVQVASSEISGIKGKARGGLGAFSELYKVLQAMPRFPVRPLVTEVIARTGYTAYLESTFAHQTETITEKKANVDELVNAAGEYDKMHPDGSLEDFLERVALVQDTDSWDGQTEAVSLMTLHAAKGLEFPAVFICGLEEGLLHHSQSLHSETELDEERRLFYVGITRAKEGLVLLHTTYRSRYGLKVASIPSSFLQELPKEVIEEEDRTSPAEGASYRGEAVSWKSASAGRVERTFTDDRFSCEEEAVSAGGFFPGQKVEHPTFGIGRVREATGRGKGQMVVVDFPVGRKTLLVEHARLKKIGARQ